MPGFSSRVRFLRVVSARTDLSLDDSVRLTDTAVVGTITENTWHTVVTLVRTRQRRINLRIFGNHVPSVDVMIVCCGEPIEVILDTVNAACTLDWPARKFRVVVADDGGCPILRKAIRKLQKTYRNLHYHSRSKYTDKHHGYKAGNLNQTLKTYVANLPGGQSEFFAVFDADMMPEPEVLRALVPHALRNGHIAMVTCAQV